MSEIAQISDTTIQVSRGPAASVLGPGPTADICTPDDTVRDSVSRAGKVTKEFLHAFGPTLSHWSNSHDAFYGAA